MDRGLSLELRGRDGAGAMPFGREALADGGVVAPLASMNSWTRQLFDELNSHEGAEPSDSKAPMRRTGSPSPQGLSGHDEGTFEDSPGGGPSQCVLLAGARVSSNAEGLNSTPEQGR